MSHFLLFDSAGTISYAESHLMLLAVDLMLIVAIPMYIILFTFARKYRAGNPSAAAKYSPNLSHNGWVTFVLWAIPITLIGILSVINWQSTHALDPSVPIVSADGAPPLDIQVIALPWKFLFIYPAQNIATVNFIEFPVGTPLHFELTADAPMSSFWIPQLGSQIYAMPAMTTQLNLIANTTGDFRGLDTEINGVGFSGMKFVARSATQSDYNAWVAGVQGASTTQAGAAMYPSLDLATYNALAAPSENNPEASYASVDPNLYNEVVMKYMMPAGEMSSTMQGMSAGQAMPGTQM
jgi:cytochrome o ubiquinol oxidase subunit II